MPNQVLDLTRLKRLWLGGREQSRAAFIDSSGVGRAVWIKPVFLDISGNFVVEHYVYTLPNGQQIELTSIELTSSAVFLLSESVANARFVMSAGGGSGAVRLQSAVFPVGGGGAGQLHVQDAPVELPSGIYRFVMGLGGARRTNSNPGFAGGNSYFFSPYLNLTLLGGGHGGYNSGGSGGNGGGASSGTNQTQAENYVPGVGLFGYSGGDGHYAGNAIWRGAGGGGGSFQPGHDALFVSNSVGTQGGHGGQGVMIPWLPTPRQVASGGGGNGTIEGLGGGDGGGTNATTGAPSDDASYGSGSGGARSALDSGVWSGSGGNGFGFFVFERGSVIIRDLTNLSINNFYGTLPSQIPIDLRLDQVPGTINQATTAPINNLGGDSIVTQLTANGTPIKRGKGVTLNTSSYSINQPMDLHNRRTFVTFVPSGSPPPSNAQIMPLLRADNNLTQICYSYIDNSLVFTSTDPLLNEYSVVLDTIPPNIWQIVEILYEDNIIQVYHNGKLYGSKTVSGAPFVVDRIAGADQNGQRLFGFMGRIVSINVGEDMQQASSITSLELLNTYGFN